ncbi:YgaP family membrane protein [Roseovarius sp. D22-M7]|uniref:YgaP family membrane protein n=1 Tax=Roseovarius sp. D22-M7 TaxID=3127116 RepID=UPI00300FFBE7
MTTNIGTIDRALRALLGLVLLVTALGGLAPVFDAGAVKWIAVAVGAVLLATAGMRICPLYTVLGIRTCKR